MSAILPTITQTVTVTAAPAQAVPVLHLRTFEQRVAELLAAATLPPAVRLQVERWLQAVAHLRMADALDEALALTELMVYIVRPAMGNDLQIAEFDEQLEELLQLLIPGKSTDAFIKRKIAIDLKREGAAIKLALAEQAGTQVETRMAQATHDTQQEVRDYYAASMGQLGAFNGQREAMATEAAERAHEVWQQAHRAAREQMEPALERALQAAEDLGDLERLTSDTYNQILGAVHGV